MMSGDPVFFEQDVLPGGEIVETRWYFWDGSWANRSRCPSPHGPFKTETEARRVMDAGDCWCSTMIEQIAPQSLILDARRVRAGMLRHKITRIEGLHLD